MSYFNKRLKRNRRISSFVHRDRERDSKVIDLSITSFFLTSVSCVDLSKQCLVIDGTPGLSETGSCNTLDVRVI